MLIAEDIVGTKTDLATESRESLGNLFQYYWDVGWNSRAPDAAVVEFRAIMDFGNLRAWRESGVR